jgi:hypothetical protein
MCKQPIFVAIFSVRSFVQTGVINPSHERFTFLCKRQNDVISALVDALQETVLNEHTQKIMLVDSLQLISATCTSRLGDL